METIFGYHILRLTLPYKNNGVTPPNVPTTSSSPNVYMDNTNSNVILRSTSSIKYKENITYIYDDETLKTKTINIVNNLKPITYQSKNVLIDGHTRYYGLIAEEVALIEPSLVHYGYNEEQYETVYETFAMEINNEPNVSDTDNNTIIKEKKVLKQNAEKVPDGIAYERLTVLLLTTIHELNSKIESLENRISIIEGNNI